MDITTIDSVTWNFEGWEYISLILGTILLMFSGLLIISAIRQSRKNAFSYVIISKLSLALYLLVLSFSRIIYYFRYGDSGTVALLVIDMIFQARSFMIAQIPVTTIIALGLIVSNIILIKKEGFYLSNLFAAVFAAVIIIANIAAVLIEIYTIELNISNELKNLWYGLYSYLSVIYVSIILWALHLSKKPISYDKDYLIILGCKVKADGTLYPLIKSRVDKAIEFANEQQEKTGKELIFVPSGGKGSDEHCSEGKAMTNYLLKNNIPKERIITEDKSATTEENMRFSKKLIDSSKNIAFATSNFHVFRSGLLARKEGMNAEGLGAKTVWYFWPNAFMREFVGQLWELKKGYIIIFSVIAIVFYFMPKLIYLG